MANYNYTDHLVVYLDILGFGETIRRLKKESDIAKLLESLNRAQAIAEQYSTSYSQGKALRHFAFSDTIILTSAQPSSATAVTISYVTYLQAVMALRGQFLRGAAVVGKHYQHDHGAILLGPAYLKAHEMEQKSAIWARVLIDASTLADHSPALKVVDRHNLINLDFPIVRAQDGMLFTDYLFQQFFFAAFAKWRSPKNRTNPKRPPYSPRTLLFRHKMAIHKQVHRLHRQNKGHYNDPSLLPRYHSLASYHNDAIDRIANTINGELDTDSDYVGPIGNRFFRLLVNSDGVPEQEARRRYKSMAATLIRETDILKLHKIALRDLFAPLYPAYPS